MTCGSFRIWRGVVPLAAQPGWAWAPGDRYGQDGQPHPLCGRCCWPARATALAAQGLQVLAAFEIEWVISTGGEELHARRWRAPGTG